MSDRQWKKAMMECNEDDIIENLKKQVATHTATKAKKIRSQKFYTIYTDHVTLKNYGIHNEAINRLFKLKVNEQQREQDENVNGGGSFSSVAIQVSTLQNEVVNKSLHLASMEQQKVDASFERLFEEQKLRVQAAAGNGNSAAKRETECAEAS
ncbi:unnamed protein product [Linum tenue]|uniref:Uncharacterized protein n=1 Tax=Linum tenue TaxID=586396 RepID=A0AAV0JQR8_9ROSI|nr:unnamed protein product [Linum tenue]